MLTLLSGVLESYFPLVWSTPVEYGGLNLSPASIGLWASLYGGMDGICQFFCFTHLISRFGHRRVFVFSIVSSAVILAIFPFENLAAVAGGGSPNMAVWLLVIVQLLSYCVFDMGYGEHICAIHPSLSQILMTYVGPPSYDVHVHFVCRSEQTVARHRVWSFAGGFLGSERYWARCCGPAVCVLPDV